MCIRDRHIGIAPVCANNSSQLLRQSTKARILTWVYFFFKYKNTYRMCQDAVRRASLPPLCLPQHITRHRQSKAWANLGSDFFCTPPITWGVCVDLFFSPVIVRMTGVGRVRHDATRASPYSSKPSVKNPSKSPRRYLHSAFDNLYVVTSLTILAMIFLWRAMYTLAPHPSDLG